MCELPTYVKLTRVAQDGSTLFRDRTIILLFGTTNVLTSCNWSLGRRQKLRGVVFSLAVLLKYQKSIIHYHLVEETGYLKKIKREPLMPRGQITFLSAERK